MHSAHLVESGFFSRSSQAWRRFLQLASLSSLVQVSFDLRFLLLHSGWSRSVLQLTVRRSLLGQSLWLGLALQSTVRRFLLGQSLRSGNSSQTDLRFLSSSSSSSSLLGSSRRFLSQFSDTVPSGQTLRFFLLHSSLATLPFIKLLIII